MSNISISINKQYKKDCIKNLNNKTYKFLAKPSNSRNIFINFILSYF